MARELKNPADAQKETAALESRAVRGDVESLLRQLAQQQESTSRALQCTLAIEKQLAETREELNRALMMAAIPPDPPPRAEGEDGDDSPEGASRRAHQELESERKARIDERVTAAAQIARLEETVAHAREKEQFARDRLKRTRMLGIAAAVILLLSSMLFTRAAARYPSSSVARALNATTPDAAPTPTPTPMASDASGQGSVPAAANGAETSDLKPATPDNFAPQSSLEQAVAHMHRALTAFPDANADAIIHALQSGSVKVDPQSCLLAWNAGEPELLLQDRRSSRFQIASTLTQCASAIEQAHGNMILKSQPR